MVITHSDISLVPVVHYGSVPNLDVEENQDVLEEIEGRSINVNQDFAFFWLRNRYILRPTSLAHSTFRHGRLTSLSDLDEHALLLGKLSL
jgi:hypothetical protein